MIRQNIMFGEDELCNEILEKRKMEVEQIHSKPIVEAFTGAT